MELEELSLSEWEETLPDDGFGVFHTPEALRVIDEHAAGELRLFGGFKGEQAIGLLPVFVRERSGFRLVLSPPTGFGIRELGPVLMPTSPKRRKQEKVNREFTRQVIEAVGADDPRTLFRMSCGTWYGDPRSYRWNGFRIEPVFTYRLDLESVAPDEVLNSFSKSLRREIRDGEDTDISIGVRGMDGARKVYEATQDRYAEQGKGLALSWGFMRDLLESLGDRARVYVAESADGEFLSGIVVLYSNDTAYFWKGGARRSHRNLSVNSLLHWRIINDVITDPPRESVHRYDFHTANNERLVRYKSKFGGELVPHYRVESTGMPMAVAKRAYRMVVFGEHPFDVSPLSRLRS